MQYSWCHGADDVIDTYRRFPPWVGSDFIVNFVCLGWSPDLMWDCNKTFEELNRCNEVKTLRNGNDIGEQPLIILVPRAFPPHWGDAVVLWSWQPVAIPQRWRRHAAFLGKLIASAEMCPLQCARGEVGGSSSFASEDTCMPANQTLGSHLYLTHSMTLPWLLQPESAWHPRKPLDHPWWSCIGGAIG